MAIQTTYTRASENLSKLCDDVVDNREVVIIRRRGGKNVALIAEEELASLSETAHLLRSPRNAERLLKALERARSGSVPSQPVDKLRREVGLE